ncbi:efflux RND transporter periplasmic adaptor subunit [Candidatus Pelagisphaera phototrophica]|uniref:efflux RND transporter periplasmic adaptor subunit n=1 Tax=Candidatus Pelagisphaera phototrophica TaxID=2684113 RepID=UPI0019F37396|nr:efflux RND transporter periplasmic adaptor subunit [Candidatus Pelagisphaera phototrophica]QXD30896.1 efflux RND transporter periplasmic adaptor subunit [Candidatus Pelagisphaera phototrophica]
MKFLRPIRFCSIPIICLLASQAMLGQDKPENIVILDDVAVVNLGIETVEVDYQDFAETLFVIGRIEPIPSRKSVLSSRIPGRVVKIHAFEGDIVSQNAPIIEIESLQPGDPPPRVSLGAPLPGMVMKNHTHIGKPVVSDLELFEIVDLSQVYAVARIPEDQAGKLSIGTKAEIRVAALPDDVFEGELERFGTEANTENGTIDALFIIENPHYKARPNMRVEFSILLSTKKKTLSIPRSALQADGINRIVFVKDFELPNAFLKSPVRIGAQNESSAEVLNGLFPGDEVVTKGAYSLLFAGGGISLKEALDAAHGHEHNEDGSEMTAEQQSGRGSRDGMSQNEFSANSKLGQLIVFLAILSGLLVILLVLSIAFPRHPKERAER